MKTKFLIIFLLGLFVTSCSDDDDLKPIMLKDREDRSINLTYYPNETGYTYSLQGGDGNYSIKSGNDEIVTAEMISSTDFRLKSINVGETTVTITDNSQNTLVLNIQVDYETYNFVINKHDIVILGDDLTENEKKAIREKQLAEIPVKEGGGYKFIHTDIPNRKGKAFIYKEAFDSHRTETTFEFKEIKNKDIPETASWGYEVAIDDEKRLFVIGRYHPLFESARSDIFIPMALIEDITHKVQAEYPKAELVYTYQVVRY